MTEIGGTVVEISSKTFGVVVRSVQHTKTRISQRRLIGGKRRKRRSKERLSAVRNEPKMVWIRQAVVEIEGERFRGGVMRRGGSISTTGGRIEMGRGSI